MHAFCTYCSAHKSRDSGEIPAIRRYRSPRLDKVHNAALQLGVGFFILSGEFGLIPPERTIPWYDHLLTASEVPSLAEYLIEQIEQVGITRLVYFTRPLAVEPAVVPYHDALAIACTRVELPFLAVELGELGG